MVKFISISCVPVGMFQGMSDLLFTFKMAGPNECLRLRAILRLSNFLVATKMGYLNIKIAALSAPVLFAV